MGRGRAAVGWLFSGSMSEESRPRPCRPRKAATTWAVRRCVGEHLGYLDASDDLLTALDENDFDTLPMTASHSLAAGRLPPHHTDPFDRMLIAQAAAQDLTIATVDGRFNLYDVALHARRALAPSRGDRW